MGWTRMLPFGVALMILFGTEQVWSKAAAARARARAGRGFGGRTTDARGKATAPGRLYSSNTAKINTALYGKAPGEDTGDKMTTDLPVKHQLTTSWWSKNVPRNNRCTSCINYYMSECQYCTDVTVMCGDGQFSEDAYEEQSCGWGGIYCQWTCRKDKQECGCGCGEGTGCIDCILKMSGPAADPWYTYGPWSKCPSECTDGKRMQKRTRQVERQPLKHPYQPHLTGKTCEEIAKEKNISWSEEQRCDIDVPCEAPEGYELMPGLGECMPNNNERRQPGSLTLAECAAACSKDVSCKYFDHKGSGCYTQPECPQRRSNDDYRAYKKLASCPTITDQNACTSRRDCGWFKDKCMKPNAKCNQTQLTKVFERSPKGCTVDTVYNKGWPPSIAVCQCITLYPMESLLRLAPAANLATCDLLHSEGYTTFAEAHEYCMTEFSTTYEAQPRPDKYVDCNVGASRYSTTKLITCSDAYESGKLSNCRATNESYGDRFEFIPQAGGKTVRVTRLDGWSWGQDLWIQCTNEETPVKKTVMGQYKNEIRIQLRYPNTNCPDGFSSEMMDEEACEAHAAFMGKPYKKILTNDANWVNGCFQHTNGDYWFNKKTSDYGKGNLGGDRVCGQDKCGSVAKNKDACEIVEGCWFNPRQKLCVDKRCQCTGKNDLIPTKKKAYSGTDYGKSCDSAWDLPFRYCSADNQKRENFKDRACWCPKPWCYVQKECPYSIPSNFFKDSALFYSYATCGNDGNDCFTLASTPDEVLDPCRDIDCGANGSCEEGNCVCTDGFTGDNCENDPCQNVDCGPEGECKVGKCICAKGWTGDNCEFEYCFDYGPPADSPLNSCEEVKDNGVCEGKPDEAANYCPLTCDLCPEITERPEVSRTPEPTDVVSEETEPTDQEKATAPSPIPWINVSNEELLNIAWDLESTGIEIRTDSVAGSGEMVWLRMLDDKKAILGGITIYFDSALAYDIGYCHSKIPFPVIPPSGDGATKVWAISKTATHFRIKCDGKELASYDFTKFPDSVCKNRWAGDKVSYIHFYTGDTASDAYRAVAQAAQAAQPEMKQCKNDIHRRCCEYLTKFGMKSTGAAVVSWGNTPEAMRQWHEENKCQEVRGASNVNCPCETAPGAPVAAPAPTAPSPKLVCPTLTRKKECRSKKDQYDCRWLSRRRPKCFDA